jgi:hypothetical protein
MGIQDLFRRPKMPRVPLHCLRRVKELGVVESKRGAIRKGLVQELLYAQDTVLCSYFAQREGATGTKVDGVRQQKCSKDWTDSDEYLGVTMRWGLKKEDRSDKHKHAS